MKPSTDLGEMKEVDDEATFEKRTFLILSQSIFTFSSNHNFNISTLTSMFEI